MSRREERRKFQESKTRRKSKSANIERKKMNKQAKLTTILISLIFVFMIGYYVFFVVEESQKVVNNSYNKRIDASASSVIRGTIYSRSKKKLAYTDTKGTETDISDDTREYPYGRIFSHAIGITTHGKYGLEQMQYKKL